MQARGLTAGVVIDPRPDRRVLYSVMQFCALLRETASGKHIMLGKGLLVVGEARECHVALADFNVYVYNVYQKALSRPTIM